jgi:hypothetical protein
MGHIENDAPIFYCYRGNVSTEPLSSNDKGFFTEPLRSNDRRDIHTHRRQRDLISLLYFYKISNVGYKSKAVPVHN